MTGRELDLCSEQDARGGTRHVWLRLGEHGALILEGQDLGGEVTSFFGDDVSEYEWAWELPRRRIRRLLDSLGVDRHAPDLLGELASRLRELSALEMQKRFEESGAEFWSRVGD